MEEAIFLPVLSHFENENFWTASGGRMRYRVDPVKGDEENPPSLTAQVWEGPWRLQDSTVEETKSLGWRSCGPGYWSGRRPSMPGPPGA